MYTVTGGSPDLMHGGQGSTGCGLIALSHTCTGSWLGNTHLLKGIQNGWRNSSLWMPQKSMILIRLAPPSPPSFTVCPQILQVELHNDLEDENETAQTQTPTPRGEGDPDSIPRATLNRFVGFV